IFPKRLGFALAIVLALIFIYRLYPRNLIRQSVDALSAHKPLLHYTYTLMDGDSLTGFDAEAEAVPYLRTADHTGEPIEVISYNRPYLRVKAHLESATRFTELLPLAMRTPQGTFTTYQLGWRNEFVQRLQE